MFRYAELKKTDGKVMAAVMGEMRRQEEGLEMIASENYASRAVMEALGSILTNKYSEGYPGARYYAGNDYVDQIENIARERAKKLFGVPYANVQPYSGSPANFAVYVALCDPGDTVMGLDLTNGGHLTHGWKASATSMFFRSIQYHVKENGYIDIEEVERLAEKHRPKLIWIGATAYVREFPFEEFSRIAEKVGAYLVADIAHVSGLVVAGVHRSPVPYAHVVTTTTHKTLRGPRGGIIMVTEKGMKKDAELPAKIDQAVFPRLQGGPHDHQTAAIAVALKEAETAKFRAYGKQVVQNARALADELLSYGLELVSGGTDNHMVLLCCGSGRGVFLEKALDEVGITVNKNTIPREPSSPFYPSGVRIGTPAVTTRGLRTAEMKCIAGWIARTMRAIETYQLPNGKGERIEYLKRFLKEIRDRRDLRAIRRDVRSLCKKFPLYR